MRGGTQRWHRACWRLARQHGSGNAGVVTASISNIGIPVVCARSIAESAGSRRVASAAAAAGTRAMSQISTAASGCRSPAAAQPFVSSIAARFATELRAALSSNSAYHSAAARAAAASPAAAPLGGARSSSAAAGGGRHVAASSRAAFSTRAAPAAVAPQQSPVLASNPGLLKRWTGFGQSSGSAGM